MKKIVIFNNKNIPVPPPQESVPAYRFDRFTSLVQRSEKILLKTSSVFPFDFFPDEITIDEYKVSIVFHEFFLSQDIHSIPIEMIKDIELEAGPLFATLKIVPDGYPAQSLQLRFLKKKDALKARNIIQGLIVARRQGVDVAKSDSPEFLHSLELIGRAHIEGS